MHQLHDENGYRKPQLIIQVQSQLYNTEPDVELDAKLYAKP